MRKLVVAAAILLSASSVMAATAQKDQARYIIENLSAKPVVLSFYDFDGQWAHPLYRKEKVTLQPNAIFDNTLSGSDYPFVGVEIMDEKNPNNNVVFFSGSNPSFQQDSGLGNGTGNMQQHVWTNNCASIVNGVSQCNVNIN